MNNTPSEITNVQQAIAVLVQAAEIGQKKGIYTFKDSSMIYQAVSKLYGTPEQRPVQEPSVPAPVVQQRPVPVVQQRPTLRQVMETSSTLKQTDLSSSEEGSAEEDSSD